MNLAKDIENAAHAWIGVGSHQPEPQHDDSFERGYRAALRSCGGRLIEILDEHVDLEAADAVRRGVTS